MIQIETCNECNGSNVVHNAWSHHSPVLGRNVLERTHDDPPWCIDCDCEVETTMVDSLEKRYKIEREYTYGWDSLNEDEPTEYYATREAAEAEIDDLIESIRDAVEQGHMEHAESREEYRVIEEDAPSMTMGAAEALVFAALSGYAEDCIRSDIEQQTELTAAWQHILRGLNG